MTSPADETPPSDTERHNAKMARKKQARDKIMATKTSEKGLLIVHTGKGKGKSSAAFGMIFRCIAHGLKCAVVQFIKGGMDTGERNLISGHFGSLCEFHTMGEGFTWETQDRERDIAAATAAWEKAKELIRGDGKPHIGDVAGAKIDLGRASRTLDDDQIGIAPDDLETVQNTGQQLGLVGAVFAGPHAAEPPALDDDLRSCLAFRLQQDRIHMDRCRGAAAACLHRLRAADLAAILGHGGVV